MLDNGRRISLDDPTFCGAEIQIARKKDSGVWRCIATNSPSDRITNKKTKTLVIVQSCKVKNYTGIDEMLRKNVSEVILSENNLENRS